MINLTKFFLILFLPLCATAAPPRGVFSLTGAGRIVPSSVLNNPNVDGVSIPQHWKDLAPTATNGVPNYNWSYLDSQVNAVGATGKKITLRVQTGSGGATASQGQVPDWVIATVTARGGQFFTFYDVNSAITRTIPVFWDHTFLNKKAQMLVDLGNHFATSPYRNQIVTVYVGYANAQTSDWNIPDSTTVDGIPPAGSTETSRWIALGFTNQKIIDAGCPATGTGLIDRAVAAFPQATYPNVVVTFSQGAFGKNIDPTNPGITGCPTCTGAYMPLTAFNNAKAKHPGRVGMQDDSLCQKVAANQPFSGQPANNRYRAIYEASPNVSAQMLWNTADLVKFAVPGYTGNRGAALREAIDTGFDYGMTALEIYQLDIVATVDDLPETIAYAHNLLNTTQYGRNNQ